MPAMETKTIVGQGAYTYEVDNSWGRRAGGVEALGVAQGVTGDSQNRVYIFQRSPTTEVLVFDRDGKLLNRWGDGQFVMPHGIWCSPKDELYITDTNDHTVSIWTLDGKKLRQWGTPQQPGEFGKPFNRPTQAVVTPDGQMYVTDGYGNKHVHRYDKDGNLIHTWGEEGTGPGQFSLPHSIWIDERDRVLICDRQNKRVQIFDRDGKYQSEWHMQNPMQIYVRDGVMHIAHAYAEISIRDMDGNVLAGWPWESTVPEAREKSPHSLWVDSRGDIYVGEVVGENGFQKFVKRR
jgi:sugar lactone lactonase YvrE